MIHARIKRELWRSIAIFFIAMMGFVGLTAFVNNYYWLILVGSTLVVIAYMTAVVIWVKKKGSLLEEMEKNSIIKLHREMVWGLLAIVMFVHLPLLILLHEFNWSSVLVSMIFVFLFVWGVFLVFSANKKIRKELSKNKYLLEVQRKLIIKLFPVIILTFLLLSLCYVGFYIFHLWAIWLIVPVAAIPLALYVEKSEKKLYESI